MRTRKPTGTLITSILLPTANNAETVLNISSLAKGLRGKIHVERKEPT